MLDALKSLPECHERQLNCQNPASGANDTQLCIGISRDNSVIDVDASKFCNNHVVSMYATSGRSPYDIRHAEDDPILGLDVSIFGIAIMR